MRILCCLWSPFSTFCWPFARVGDVIFDDLRGLLVALAALVLTVTYAIMSGLFVRMSSNSVFVTALLPNLPNCGLFLFSLQLTFARCALKSPITIE